MHVEDASGLSCALEHRAKPQEAHRLFVQHGAAHDAQAQLRAAPNMAKELFAVALIELLGALELEP
jgi:hypothetical protein